ncbi:MAG: N-acetyltransferase [Deltaproteobacteria bacterium]|nr:N-acetyltransferase [Deltaproteobacteria bacterium]
MIRQATTGDVKTIQSTLEYYAREGLLLPRSLSDLYDHLRDFIVYEKSGEIFGVSALHVCGEDLGEIRSLAVLPPHTKRGIGRELVHDCEKEAVKLGLKRLFTLTYQESFFAGSGFQTIDKSQLPHKVWGDCLKCAKFPDCDEIAMIKTLTV